ncbi:PREDICTED: uncharacterized protein LOC108976047 [Bactrocera latifrons]|uniref:uncharacterized protein LOC108976047 n=1 Tax=Bactrocera latifrons TaxID=174628 RepID=UPI0008DE4998|nr:PREDICTED: uncharacterized protein LOC108976047 [Bactrocera latifrons]
MVKFESDDEQENEIFVKKEPLPFCKSSSTTTIHTIHSSTHTPVLTILRKIPTQNGKFAKAGKHKGTAKNFVIVVRGHRRNFLPVLVYHHFSFSSWATTATT